MKKLESVNHPFLIAILKKIGFGSEFIEWIKVLLNNQESCVINGVKTSKYFNLEQERLSVVTFENLKISNLVEHL